MPSVLVADSQRLFAESLRRALRNESGLEVLSEDPQSGREAVDAVVKLSPDVVVLDYWMVGMNGPPATRVILSKAPQQKVILLCWFHAAPEIREGVKAGAAAVISKDVEVANLAEAIRQVHAGMPLLGGEETKVDPTGGDDSGDNAWEGLVSLTPRELEILSYLAASGRPHDVAARLSLSTGTVRIHIQNIMAKTGARSHVEAVIIARQHGLI